MEIVKRIGRIFSGNNSRTPKLENSLEKVEQADQITETINKRLKDMRRRLDNQKTIKQG